MKIPLCFLMTAFFVNCGSKQDFYSLPTFSAKHQLNCVIEIPSGTNKKWEYDKETGKFKIDIRKGKERVIDFLPYPANYGFIPSTFSKIDQGGDGDALDVIVIAESLGTGTVIETLPIGILKLIDNGEMDFKIVCVPSDKRLQIIDAQSFKQLQLKYPGIITILERWFLDYDNGDKIESEGWGDQENALLEIVKAAK